jgi:lipoprotein-anchoring transpeptidase ErfK/SrfK
VVDYASRQTPGTVIIDTGNTFLYFVLNDTQAMRYGIGVGREGFTWSGEQTVARKAEWPDWHPPAEMVSRQPYLPRFMAGGPGNPLGARAMYLGETEYRIHGTNNPDTIGKRVSSGCIRLTNEDVVDLYERVKVGAKVIVLPATAARRPSQGAPTDAAFRLPDPASPSKRPLAANAQMPSSGPKIAEAQ